MQNLKELVEEKLNKQSILDIFHIDKDKVDFNKNGQIRTVCPFHKDTKPSFSLNIVKGLYKCYSCGEQGNVYSFVRKHYNVSKPLLWIADFLKIDKGQRAPIKEIPMAEILEAKKCLQDKDNIGKKVRLLDYGISEEIINARHIGYKDGRYWIPIFDDTGNSIVNVRKYDPDNSESKVVSYRSGYGDNRLYPYSSLYQVDTIYVMEGEKDTLVALSKGLNAITNTTGAQSWNSACGELFKEKDVIIVLDIDDAGKKGAEVRAKNIYPYAKTLKVVTLDLSIDLFPHGDFTNYMQSRTIDDFAALVASTKKYEFVPNAQVTSIYDSLMDIVKLVQPIDFKAEFLKLNEQTESDKEFVMKQKNYKIVIVKYLLNWCAENKMYLANQGDQYYIFNGCYWVPASEDDIQHFLIMSAVKLGYRKLDAEDHLFAKDLLCQFKISAYFKPISRSQKIVINTKNCALEFVDGDITRKEFDPEDFLKYKLPYDYEPDAKCPIFDAYFAEMMPNHKIRDIVQEFMGWAFIKHSVMKLEKTMIMLGDGENGKSVMFTVMDAIFGKENISHVGANNLNEEHYRALLANKLINYCTELQGNVDTEILKNMASGEPIMVREKYGHPYHMTDYAKIVFNANKAPTIVEHTHGFYRKLLIIPWSVRVNQDRKDIHLPNKIIDQELSGVFNWVIEGMKRLIKNNRFTVVDEVEQAMENYKRDTDSVYQFIDTLREISYDMTKVFVDDAYNRYRQFCIEGGYKAVHKVNFAKRLGSLGGVACRGHRGRYYSFGKAATVYSDLPEDPKMELD